jgi:hypothetical protein
MVGVVGIVMYGAAVFIIFQCLFVYIPLVYPRYAASLFASNDFSRSALAFAFILFSRHMFINLGVDKGVTLLAGLSVLGIVSLMCVSHIPTVLTDVFIARDDRSLFLRREAPCSIKVHRIQGILLTLYQAHISMSSLLGGTKGGN